MRGDDVFGRKLSISYFRDQTAEEAECETRYAAAYKEAREKELARLQAGTRRGLLRARARAEIAHRRLTRIRAGRPPAD